MPILAALQPVSRLHVAAPSLPPFLRCPPVLIRLSFVPLGGAWDGRLYNGRLSVESQPMDVWTGISSGVKTHYSLGETGFYFPRLLHQGCAYGMMMVEWNRGTDDVMMERCTYQRWQSCYTPILCHLTCPKYG
jgi:hypothetical protein